MSEYLRIPDRAIEHWNDHPRRAAAITVAAELRRADELDPEGSDAEPA